MKQTEDFVQHCVVGDKPDDCVLAAFCAASFAGWTKESKSTTGLILVLLGPRTFVPLTWCCKKQGAVSHSSYEAEVIALDAATRMEGIPARILWEEVISVLSPNAPTLK